MRAGSWETIEAFVAAAGIRFGPGSRTRPGDPGFHGRGQARDFGLKNSDAHAVSRLFAPIARAYPRLVPEMFGSDGVGYDEGKVYQEPGHTGDHTHVAIGAGVTLEQLQAAHARAPKVGAEGMTGRPGGGNWDGSDADVAPPSNAGAPGGGRIGELAELADRAASKATPAFGLRVIYLLGGVLGLTVATVGILRATGVLEAAGRAAQTIPTPHAQVAGAVIRGVG